MTTEMTLNTAQLEVLASPACNEVAMCLHGMRRASSSDVAKKMGKSPATALYHLRRLLSVGLVVEVEKRQTNRRPEVIYAPAAARLKLPDSDTSGLITKAVLAGLRDAMRGFAASPGRGFKHTLRAHVRLSESDAREFLKMLDAADRFASEHAASDGVHLRWTSVVYPE